MVCIYCGSPTQVVNSRAQKRLMQVWRRRHCSHCGAVFTTHELVDLASGFAVRHADGSIKPFSRDKLYTSVLRACGHREGAIDEAGALTATIISKLRRQTDLATLKPEYIARISLETLQQFDTAAGVQYGAYHKQKSTTA